MRQINLQAVQAAVARYIPKESFEGATLDAEWCYDIDAMAVRLKRYVMSERLADETVSWPATWWDAVKERWFPDWLLRRYPVEYKHADFTIYRGYPDIMPEKRSVLYTMRDA